MDTSDLDITFDEYGICSHCRYYDQVQSRWWYLGKEGEERFSLILDKIKRKGERNPYDCLIGLSGGVDSSYVTYMAKTKFNLKPLIIHVDTGWNSELAVKNIQNIVERLDLDLYTYVIDWDEMRELQLAFLRSGIENQDIPQDHSFLAVMRKQARKHGIKYFLTGANISTESILPNVWGSSAVDSKLIKSIYRRFGSGKKLKSYPFISFFEYFISSKFIHNLIKINPLNYIDYRKDEAMRVLEQQFDWKYYGGKHFESIFTKFFQAFYLPMRYGYDKRRSHYSSLIVTDQMDREIALQLMEKPPYDEKSIKEDKIYLAKKLNLSMKDFEKLLKVEKRSHNDFLNNQKYIDIAIKIYHKLLKE